jgi:tetratricopeptide (TPR) repeat protein
LGNAYRAARRPDRAVQEFALALEFAPRDIFILRSLGLAYLDANRTDEAEKIIRRIAELDKEAFSRNVECAALKARFQRERSDFQGAADTYRAALEHNPDSYYLADVLGQTLLRLGRIEEARGAYSRAAEIIARVGEKNIWTCATRATAAAVAGDEPGMLAQLKAIADLAPNADELKRIEDGLERVQKWLNLEPAAFERWRAALRGKP